MIQFISCDGKEIHFKKIPFSDGSTNYKLFVDSDFIIKDYYIISIDASTPCDNVLWELMLIKDALDVFVSEKTICKSNLMLNYLPHARADRRFETGNSFPLKVFTKAISNLDFSEIYVIDAHSNYFIDNVGTIVNHIEQWDCFLNIDTGIQSGDVLVAPDKGARKKIVDIQHRLDKKVIATFVVEASKKRDIETGRIIETTLSDNMSIQGKRCIIIDDIADGGGTFIPLAEKLKQAGATRVDLYVTHGIFAKGIDIFNGILDNIYCHQIIGNYITKQDLINFNERN